MGMIISKFMKEYLFETSVILDKWIIEFWTRVFDRDKMIK
jgi:hypothetical protein